VAEHTERVVPVVIQGQRYPVRSALDPQYVVELAAYVEEKMRSAAETGSANDTLRLAVLAALNIADELFRVRDGAPPDHSELLRRTSEIERIVDRALDRLHL
jgi:cell division protein ZapA